MTQKIPIIEQHAPGSEQVNSAKKYREDGNLPFDDLLKPGVSQGHDAIGAGKVNQLDLFKKRSLQDKNGKKIELKAKPILDSNKIKEKQNQTSGNSLGTDVERTKHDTEPSEIAIKDIQTKPNRDEVLGQVELMDKPKPADKTSKYERPRHQKHVIKNDHPSLPEQTIMKQERTDSIPEVRTDPLNGKQNSPDPQHIQTVSREHLSEKQVDIILNQKGVTVSHRNSTGRLPVDDHGKAGALTSEISNSKSSPLDKSIVQETREVGMANKSPLPAIEKTITPEANSPSRAISRESDYEQNPEKVRNSQLNTKTDKMQEIPYKNNNNGVEIPKTIKKSSQDIALTPLTEKNISLEKKSISHGAQSALDEKLQVIKQNRSEQNTNTEEAALKPEKNQSHEPMRASLVTNKGSNGQSKNSNNQLSKTTAGKTSSNIEGQLSRKMHHPQQTQMAEKVSVIKQEIADSAQQQVNESIERIAESSNEIKGTRASSDPLLAGQLGGSSQRVATNKKEDAIRRTRVSIQSKSSVKNQNQRAETLRDSYGVKAAGKQAAEIIDESPADDLKQQLSERIEILKKTQSFMTLGPEQTGNQNLHHSMSMRVNPGTGFMPEQSHGLAHSRTRATLFARNFAMEMVDNLRNVVSKQVVGSANIKAKFILDGGDMGQLDIEFLQESNRDQITIYVDNENSRNDLIRILPQINDNLNQRGFNLSQLEVEVRSNQQQHEPANRHEHRNKSEDQNETQQAENGLLENNQATTNRNYGYNTMEVLA